MPSAIPASLPLPGNASSTPELRTREKPRMFMRKNICSMREVKKINQASTFFSATNVFKFSKGGKLKPGNFALLFPAPAFLLLWLWMRQCDKPIYFNSLCISSVWKIHPCRALEPQTVQISVRDLSSSLPKIKQQVPLA